MQRSIGEGQATVTVSNAQYYPNTSYIVNILVATCSGYPKILPDENNERTLQRSFMCANSGSFPLPLMCIIDTN